jgi:hypothetical protein
MFAMVALALTMLLGFAWAVLSDDAENRILRLRRAPIQCCRPVRGQDADRTRRFEHVSRTRANVIAGVRFWKMSRAPRARQTT